MNQDARISEIIAIENERCRALVEDDFDAVRRLISEDLVHVHTRGNIDNYDQYLDRIQNLFDFKAVTRGDLTIRFYGDIAISTGPMINRVCLRSKPDVDPVEVSSTTTIVWHKFNGAWKIVSFHASTDSLPTG